MWFKWQKYEDSTYCTIMARAVKMHVYEVEINLGVKSVNRPASQVV